jgi:hypothetical protein
MGGWRLGEPQLDPGLFRTLVAYSFTRHKKYVIALGKIV